MIRTSDVSGVQVILASRILTVVLGNALALAPRRVVRV